MDGSRKRPTKWKGSRVALSDVIAAVADVLTELGVADQVLTNPPAKLPDDRVFVVYVDPGDATLFARKGNADQSVVYGSSDDIRVDWFRKIARDKMAEAYPEARDVLIATRGALFRSIRTGLNGSIHACSGLRTDVFGPMTYWNSDEAFGFRLAIQCQYATEV
jgi:hypothetical protein